MEVNISYLNCLKVISDYIVEINELHKTLFIQNHKKYQEFSGTQLYNNDMARYRFLSEVLEKFGVKEFIVYEKDGD